MPFYAHTHPDPTASEGEPLERHLADVGELAARFAAAFGAEEWGRLTGLWHDLGKYRPEFQRRLAGSGEQVEHAGLGAALAARKHAALGLPLAFVIAGHHAGLANPVTRSDSGLTPLQDRLAGNRAPLAEVLPSVPEEIRGRDLPPWPERLALGGKDPRSLRSLELWIRFLFSALVDADSLVTEAFEKPGERQRLLGGFSDLSTLIARLDGAITRKIDSLGEEQRTSPVNRARAEVLGACRLVAEHPPGLFTLTVPTGGGKTLASMDFALRHAQRWGLRRVIVAIPFTTIIDQSARVYTEALGTENVIQHHSALDPEKETDEERLREQRRARAAENWDAPVIVTTNVQLFESLFSNRRSRCRKLHRIAGSVLLLDEAQTLPAEYLAPTLEVLEELMAHYGCSVVLSTATQPALARRESLPFGLAAPHEIVPDPVRLAAELKRVEVRWPDLDAPPTSYPELAAQLVELDRVLAVVHRRADARELAELLPEEGRFHLSALMCPAHRLTVLDQVKARLASGGTCRLVATQLIEAGVDVDFPVVYRALGGLDSLAQAAGRANREGLLLPGLGLLVVFRAPTSPPPGLPDKGLKATEELLREEGARLRLDCPEIFEKYFRKLYFLIEPDARGVQAARTALEFATVAQRYRLIEDGYTRPIVVPWGAAPERLARLQREGPNRRTLRGLQPFLVNVPERNLRALLHNGTAQEVADGVYALSEVYRDRYHESWGLRLDLDPVLDPELLITE
ncbi:MAG TPA: CRISPR-associated endonuclease Cas3'' [Thermoanaerobaculia bacterium]|nr:CRISPR-associated endonuclease Cas3'' [Thermoanaerobaculia bacterium]